MGHDFYPTPKCATAIGNEPVVATETDEIFIGTLKLVSGSHTITNDVLIFGSTFYAILLYLECVCRVFKKYRVSFWLDNCYLLNYRIKYVGNDKTEKENYLSQSIFDLTNY